MKIYYWCDGSGRLSLTLEPDDISSGYHQGDCESDVRGLMAKPRIRAQLDAMNPDDVRANLREYGAWDEAELADYDMCLVRTLWLACGDIGENPEDYLEESHGSLDTEYGEDRRAALKERKP